MPRDEQYFIDHLQSLGWRIANKRAMLTGIAPLWEVYDDENIPVSKAYEPMKAWKEAINEAIMRNIVPPGSISLDVTE